MNENSREKNCPICPRGCELSAPHCGRGEEYARTGNLPKGQEHPGRLSFSSKEQQLVMKYLHHAVGVADHGGITQDMAEEMFTVLTKDETILLAELLEKLSEHWMEIAPEKPHHRGGPAGGHGHH